MNAFAQAHIEPVIHEHINTYISLLFACPIHKIRTDCPLFEIRKELVFSARLDWLKHLNPSEMKNINQHHVECLNAGIVTGCEATAQEAVTPLRTSSGCDVPVVVWPRQ